MTLTDPSRPLTPSGLPGLLPHGTYMVPILHLTYPSPTEIEVVVWCAVDSWKNFRQHRLTMPISDIAQFLRDYHADPEAVLIDAFGWEEPEAPMPEGTAGLDISSIVSALVPPKAPFIRRI